MERELIVERTCAVLDAARCLVRTGNRRRRMTDSKIQSARKLLAFGTPPKEVAKNLGVSPDPCTAGFQLPAQLERFAPEGTESYVRQGPVLDRHRHRSPVAFATRWKLKSRMPFRKCYSSCGVGGTYIDTSKGPKYLHGAGSDLRRSQHVCEHAHAHNHQRNFLGNMYWRRDNLH